jgi:hypothetical protein
VGLGALFLQNLVDNATEIFAVIAAALVVAVAARSAERSDSVGSAKRVGIFAGALVAAVVAVVAMHAQPVKLERDHLARAYARFARGRAPDAETLRGELRRAMLRHPGEAYFPLIGALVARATGEGAPLSWLARSLERGPLNGGVHLVLADVLAARGARSQALLHLRLAAMYDRTIQEQAYARAIAWAQTGEELARVFPRGLPGSELLTELCEHARGAPAVDCWREASARAPVERNQLKLAEALLLAVESGQAPCAAPADRACSDEAARVLASVDDKTVSDFRVPYFKARLLALEGNVERAVQVALDGCPASTEAAVCGDLAVALAWKSRDSKAMERAAHRYTAQRCVEPERCAQAHDEIAERYGAQGALVLALRHLMEAAKVEPSPERWIRAAEAAARAGSSISARASLERASRASRLTSDQQGRIARVEDLLRAGVRPDALLAEP